MAHLPIDDTSASATSADYGRLLLRLLVGALVLFHGVAKIIHGPGPLMGILSSHGLPPALAWGAYLGEVVAPLLLIVGAWTRAAALVVVANMLVAVAVVHVGDLGKINGTGGWAVELQAMFLFGALAIALLGAGPLSMGGRHGRWN